MPLFPRRPPRPGHAPFPVLAVVLLLALPGLALPAAAGGQMSAREPDVVPFIEARSSDLWLGAAVLTPLALIGALEGFDEELSPDPFTSDGFLPAVGRLMGDQFFGFGVSAGSFALGHLTGRERVRSVGLRALQAYFVAKVTTSSVKLAVGRQRPFVSRDSDELDPLSLDSEQHSFPSGHTSQAFALATAVSDELSDVAPWLPFLAYPLATWTGVTRVREGNHWATDVFAGAAVGILSAKWIGSARRGPPGGLTPSVGVHPVGDSGVALLLRWSTR